MKNHPAIIGIDPGKLGAFCILCNGEVAIYDTPVMNDGEKNQYDIRRMNELMKEAKALFPNIRAVIEQVGAMPGQGVTSMFSMGYGLGVWHSLLTANDIPFTRVTPQSWKKEFSLMKKEKGASILRAQELFPKADIRLKKHDGRAEALLMAEYLRRKA